MLTSQKTCAICATPLNALQARSGFLCGNLLCAWKYNTVPEAQRCTVCHRALAASEMAQRTCSDLACRRTWTVDNYLAHCRIRDQFQKEKATELRDQCAPGAGLPEGPEFIVIVVPYNNAIDSDLPDLRRERFRANLVRVILEAMALRDAQASESAEGLSAPDYWQTIRPAVEPPSPEMGAVMISACMACRGHCCSRGGEHAYLDRNTMLRYLQGHPEASADDVVELYLSHLVSRTMTDGCVYQHADGCVLPRALRSDTCNRYFCGGLKELQNRLSPETSLRVFFAPSDDNGFEHGVFAAPGYVQVVRASRASGVPAEA